MIGYFKCPSDNLEVVVGVELDRNIVFFYAYSLYFETQEGFRCMVTRLLLVRTLSFRRLSSFPGHSDGKESACNVGDLGLIPGSERSPGGGHGNPLQYSCLENPMTEKPG